MALHSKSWKQLATLFAGSFAARMAVLLMKDKHGKVIYEPYRIKVLNTINFRKSMHYNPFAYIHSEKDILKLVTTLIANTKGEGKAGDDFWVKAETLLYCALIGYIHYEAPVEEQNFSTLIEFINAMEVREDDEEFKNPVDLMFDALEAEKPNHFAVRQYKKYKLAAGKTAKSILISCGARLAVFDIAELREVTSYDELELDTLGDRKTALFLIMSDTDDSFNFLISMCYTQLFNLFDYSWSIVSDPQKAEQIENSLSAIISSDPDLALDTIGIHKDYEEMENRVVFGGFQALSWLVFLFGVVNLINTTLSNQMSRKRENSVFRAIGLTRKQLCQMTIYEGICYAFFAALATLAVGLPIAVIFARKFSEMTFHVAMPYSFPFLQMGLFVLVLFGLEVILSFWTMRRQKNQSLVEEMRAME